MIHESKGIAKSKSISNDFFCFLLFFSAFFRTYRLTSYFTYQDILILFGFVFGCFFNLQYIRSKIGVALLVIFLTSVLTLATSTNSLDPFHNFVNILKLLQCYVLFPAVCMKVLQTKTSIKFAILGFLGGACVSTVITLKANALFLFNPDFRVGGTVGHPVFLGILFAFAMIFSLSSSLHEISGWKLFRFVLLPFFAFIVIKTQSGTALLVLGVGILCWIIQIFLSESKISTKILLLVLSAFGLSSLKIYLETLQIYQRFFFNLTSTRTSDLIASSSDSTLAIRWQTIKFGWDKIKQAPILGNGLDLSGQFNLSGMQPHSIFLLAWQTGGLLLFFGSLFFFFDGIVRLVTSLSNKMIVPLTVIMGTWMSFFSNPFFYDVSFISPYYLGIFMIRCNKKENINYC